ncbi:MAG: transposase IS3 family protein integrase, partial [Rhodocyclaceae bacterium]
MIIKNNFASPMSIGEACRLMNVSRSGYLARNERNPKSDGFEEKLRCDLRKIAEEFPYYGYKRMTKALQREGHKVNHKRIYRLMAEEKLLNKRKRFTPVTTQSSHDFPKYSNLAKGFTPRAINQLAVADITYIALQFDFVYLAIIMDVFSRRFTGWELSREADAQLALNALNRAIALRGAKNMKGCIHHSDQGVQYASNAYVQRLEEVGMRSSMSDKGNSYDNAYAESAIKTIKY